MGGQRKVGLTLQKGFEETLLREHDGRGRARLEGEVVCLRALQDCAVRLAPVALPYAGRSVYKKDVGTGPSLEKG